MQAADGDTGPAPADRLVLGEGADLQHLEGGKLAELAWRIPKVALHRHLEGSIEPEVLIPIARKYGIPLPSYNVEELRPYLQVTGKDRTLLDFLKKFDTIGKVFTDRRVIEELTSVDVRGGGPRPGPACRRLGLSGLLRRGGAGGWSFRSPGLHQERRYATAAVGKALGLESRKHCSSPTRSSGSTSSSATSARASPGRPPWSAIPRTAPATSRGSCASTAAHPAERFLEAVSQAAAGLQGQECAISGAAARCLWMLHGLPGNSRELWARVTPPWPDVVDVVGPQDPPPPARRDPGPIAREFGPAMLSSRKEVTAGPLRVPLAQPVFVLAGVMCEDDLLRVARVAGLLRCVEEVDPEEVRHLLKAVGMGERFRDYLDVVRVL